MIITNILNIVSYLEVKSFPKNVYAIRIKDEKENLYDIAINHNGYCPVINNEREQSRFNDYLSNLENSTINEYFKSLKKRKPKLYSTQLEVLTDSNGELYHLSKVVG
ncbi:hypothetical protein EIB75_06840 [Epilithonimonas vandammei]|jgi:hypothetical protein|uniref:Uncharacterized protein n=2 Tax=Epilithonimonas TaxID=2782229 RepID=A0A3G8ZCV5_9FLAO|nr:MULTISPECIES: hypothetical protein [Epilithonimonas]AZI54973.1 hypothetical protein EIB75_06840 [Epilithonimonas vandammei]REC66985.1 hypothetical protein DRF58_15765 [Epilithonimonas hispanica]